MLTNLPMNDLIAKLQFIPKENSVNVYHKKYSNHNDYNIEIDLEKNNINFGNNIFFNDSKNSIQKITKEEDLVVFECVDRLLTKGYSPNNIILEKVYPSGHGTSGRLDILVTHNGGTAYMMIECKTWGKEFDKAFSKLNKDGGQLFTYFQQDKSAGVLVLYASHSNGNEVEYTNQIIKIEEEYKATSNVKDFFGRWNKIPKNNGIFESYSSPYEFTSKALTAKDLKALKQEDSGLIFNRFLEILRHNVVSDKPNAFNKIFTLFLCKIIDEDRLDDEQLHFQWLDGEDTHISFQKRLSDLYTRGMKELLEKNVTDISDSEFEKQFQQVDDEYKIKFKDILTEIRLKKNNEFAIKEVFDDDSFKENAIVVKEIVELLQTYQIRYNYRQQFLSDFFEQLLTTGLKQESGQFFTPVPVARFILKSMPIGNMIEDKIKAGDNNDLLPAIIDYSAGSGHFITESMEEVQKYINTIDEGSLKSTTKNTIINWKTAKYDWAESYVYAIEKDYRLVKTAKVSCYLHGDGLAKVIHGDGLADFKTAKEYKDRLTQVDKTYPQDNKQFDIIVSNPPYSVSAFKGMMDSEKSKNNFELFDRLTDQSSEIETLFIERTKQLLKDGGISGIILPSSILSNTGIYTKAREIIFKYFDIVSITELSSNTFMATGTNTVVLFLRRKNNADHTNIKVSVDKLFDSKKDITINGVEKPLTKYINHVWEGICLDDYLTLLEKTPNDKIKNHELYVEYNKKLGDITKIIALENEKLFYFIMAFTLIITLVKTGEKKDEKNFLGYEFSTRRGSEGIHPIQRGKTIDECTSLYDENSYINCLKANSYIYSAFNGKLQEIDKSLKNNISYINLIDMMTFDRVDFEKNISLSIKKKVKIESKWDLIQIKELTCLITKGTTPTSVGHGFQDSGINFIKIESIEPNGVLNNKLGYISSECNEKLKRSELKENDILFSIAASFGKIAFVSKRMLPANTNQALSIIRISNSNVYPKYVLNILKSNIIRQQVERDAIGIAQYNLSLMQVGNFKIPLPPKDIQEKIVKEIEQLEKVEEENNNLIKNYQLNIQELITNTGTNLVKIETFANVISGGTPSKKKFEYWENGTIPWLKSEVCKECEVYSSKDFITIEGLNQSSAKYLKSETTLIALVGATKGKTAYLKFEATTNQNIAGIKSFDKDIALDKYIYNVLKSMYFEIIKDLGQYDMLNLTSIRNIKIPLPSIDEQKKLITKIEAIEKEIEKKEQELAKIPQQKEAILDKHLK